MKLLVFVALLAFACGGPDESLPPPLDGNAVPLGSYSFASQLQGVPPGATVTWSVQEPGGGTITQAGIYTAPACPAAGQPSPFPATYHVNATYGGFTQTITVTVDEKVTGVTVTPSSVTLQPGQTQLFVATVSTSCGTHTSAAMLAPPNAA